jgi:predicted nucleic acid-binding protein
LILYLDTSSLVKLYLEEEHSDRVWNWTEAADDLATSQVALPEALSAFARRAAKGDLQPGHLPKVHASLERDWRDFVVLPVEERRAGALALRYRLRGFDAVHLAAALDLRDLLGETSVSFSAFDNKLLAAAQEEGLSCLSPLDLTPTSNEF